MLKTIEPKSRREHASWREYGFARKWTRCNCGCKAPRDKDGTVMSRTTDAAPLWFKLLLWAEDTLHHLTEKGECETARNEQVMIWDGDKQKLASAA